MLRNVLKVNVFCEIFTYERELICEHELESFRDKHMLLSV